MVPLAEPAAKAPPRRGERSGAERNAARFTEAADCGPARGAARQARRVPAPQRATTNGSLRGAGRTAPRVARPAPPGRACASAALVGGRAADKLLVCFVLFKLKKR